MIELVTTVVSSRDGHVITIAIQPFDEETWFAVFAGPSPSDAEWARIFWGPDPIRSDDAQFLKDHVEKRVKEVGAQWKGWNHHFKGELPGTGGMN
jgi:hypothetical protein